MNCCNRSAMDSNVGALAMLCCVMPVRRCTRKGIGRPGATRVSILSRMVSSRNLMAATSRMVSCSTCNPVVSRSSATRIGDCFPIHVLILCMLRTSASDRHQRLYRPIFQQDTRHLCRAPPVADQVFLFGQYFGGCFPQFRHQKNWVIPEPMHAARLMRYFAFDHPFYDSTGAGWLGHGHSTAKARAALRAGQSLQLSQNDAETFLVGCLSARETRGVDAGRAIQGIYLQARVIGQAQQSRCLSISQ